jgi:hypothetical protein
MPERPQLKPDEFCVIVNCDRLHPDDVEEVQRSLAESRYTFKVDVAQKVRTETSPEILFIGIDTKLVVRFSVKWFYGRTRRGGVQAILTAVDDVLDKSGHDRDLRPKVSLDSNGQELITTERWLRPRTKKHSWTRDHRLALGILIFSGVAAVAAVFVVPEFRRFFHLDAPQPTNVETKPTQDVTQSPAHTQTESPKPAEPPNPNQKTTTRVKGNDNVAGNNIVGNNNVVGNGNQTAPTAVAPNGIAISGGNVSNPTVNNITALPDVTMSDEQEKHISDSIGDLFSGADVTVTTVQPDQNTRDFSNRLVRIFKSKDANVEYNTAEMFVPAAGMTLHKGVSITSFPSERKAAVDTFVEALGNAGVIKAVPIYDRRDKKIEIVVNRSADTREEAKQY